MKRAGRRWAWLAIAAVALSVAVVIAVTSGRRSSHSGRPTSALAAHSVAPGDLTLAANYLGLSRSRLRVELRSGRTLAALAAATAGRSSAGLASALIDAKASRLRAAMATGRVSKTQESARLAAMRSRAEAEIHRSHVIDIGGVRILAVATGYLGVSPRRLRDERRSGRSLGEIADSTAGRSAKGLLAAVIAARRKELDAAVRERTLSEAEETRVLSSLRRRLGRQLANKVVRSGSG